VIPWTHIQVIQVTDECQPQMYPLFEAKDAEEQVCFFQKYTVQKGSQLRRCIPWIKN